MGKNMIIFIYYAIVKMKFIYKIKIFRFKEQLIPFGLTILQLFLQTLQWTENVLVNQITIGGNKPFRNVRISVYKCLNSWLMNTNSLSGIETIADEYLLSILKDIVPEKDRILLTVSLNI